MTQVQRVPAAPPARVVAAFGAAGQPSVRLGGGQGETWLVGSVVLKPTGDPVETAWRAEVLAALNPSPGFRIARPVRTRDGSWTVGGWEAWHAVLGVEDHRRPDDVLRAGMAFHAAIAELPRPAFISNRDDVWASGDRMAWEEIPIAGSKAALELLQPLAAARRPVDLPSQVVHGDLLGNVLFADDGQPPTIIDWPAYYRPAAWAAAVIVGDALSWYGAGAGLIRRWAHLPEWPQMLVRALIYRIATSDATAGPDGPSQSIIDDYRPAVAVLTETS